jgi:ABC-type ATPase involved in cell division
MQLSGGMKRRLLIAKALSHEPTILFLDEPTAGVDVELRHDMWRMVRELRESGVRVCTIFPGEVDTPILENRPSPVSAEHRARILLPEDVAEAVVMAALPRSRSRIVNIIMRPMNEAT